MYHNRVLDMVVPRYDMQEEDIIELTNTKCHVVVLLVILLTSM